MLSRFCCIIDCDIKQILTTVKRIASPVMRFAYCMLSLIGQFYVNGLNPSAAKARAPLFDLAYASQSLNVRQDPRQLSSTPSATSLPTETISSSLSMKQASVARSRTSSDATSGPTPYIAPAANVDDVSKTSFYNETVLNATTVNVTSLLPPEKTQSDSWTLLVLIIFASLGVTVCAATAAQSRRKRQSYEEIQSLVV